MNKNFIIKLTILLIALIFHQFNFGYEFFRINWVVLAVCYLAITNDKYSIFVFFLIGLILDLLDSENLGFYGIYFVILGSVLSYYRVHYLNTDLAKKILIIFLSNISFLLYLDFMNLINNTPFIASENWLSIFVSPLIWLFIQLWLIPIYINQSRGYEK